MGKSENTLRILDEVKDLPVGHSKQFFKEDYGYLSLAKLREYLSKTVYVHLPTIQVSCERVYDRPSHIKLTRIR